MLKLTQIKKSYVTGDTTVQALKGVSVEFRNNEFVSILGHSGCGKTTLLNVIGGLDRYDDGDLEIKGVSTKKYKDADWDTYRNHCIGFVFQSYNLIPHQTVLSNVELALTLSGVSKSERKKRAKTALERVGLGDQLNKKPNQMSGGQMQRVAIARALVNDPEILLADEPTGALDSETSVQIMEILKEIAADRLVIMVTHNPDLAAEYSTRIVRLSDGEVISDSNPYNSAEEEKSVPEAAEEKTKEQKKEEKKLKKKTSMSFFTALSLSLNNLLTKKMRTLLTSFAGSIGIIGIALILALSNGVQLYIDSVQREALSSYPMTIESTGMDMSSSMSMFTGKGDPEELINHELDKVYSNTAMAAMTKAFTAGFKENNLTAFKDFLESEESGVAQYVSDIQYTYATPMYIYSANTENGPNLVNPSPMVDMAENMMGLGDASSPLSAFTSNSSYDTIKSYYNMWREMLDNKELIHSQYDVLAGRFPEKYDEVVLVVDRNNEVTDLTLQALGLSDPSAMVEMFMAMQNGEEFEPKSVSYTYDEILDLKFKVVLTPEYFAKNETSGEWEDRRDDDEYVEKLINDATEIKVVGVLRPAEGSVATMVGGTIGYLSSLPEYVVSKTSECKIVKEQMKHPETDVFTGLPFPAEEEETPAPVKKDSEKTAAKAEPSTVKTAVFEKPVVSPIGKSGASLTGTFIALTEEDLYAFIEENFTGEEKAQMTRIAELFLKDRLTTEEKDELIAAFDTLLAGQTVEGYGTLDGKQAYNFTKNMTKRAKLQMLEQVFQSGNYAPGQPTDPEAPTNPATPGQTDPTAPGTTTPTVPGTPAVPGTPDAPGTPADPAVPGDPTAPVVPEPVPEPEPEPEPLAKSYEEALSMLGVSKLETPLNINIYPINFEAKDAITEIINQYNEKAAAEGREEDEIIYTDYIGLILSSVTKIVNIVSYVLIAFVAISLVVSSIMIGIITYISVLERTKEIGILRSIGASKRDISRVFNAETLIVGFVSGAIGIGLTVLIIIPVNLLLEYLTTLGAAAALPVDGAIILVIISMFLTFISGLIPSRIAANKDPVEALRTE